MGFLQEHHSTQDGIKEGRYFWRTSYNITHSQKYHHCKYTHKFYFGIPKSVNDSYTIDNKNRNHLHDDYTRKYFKNIQLEFKIIDGSDKLAVG